MRKAKLATMCAAVALASSMGTTPAQAQYEPFIGQMMLAGFNFCPRGWASANGQLLSISQNTALFSLLGTQFGGNGQTTFGLPDLRGRVPVGFGQASGGGSFYNMGQMGGLESVTLTIPEMPQHTHTARMVADKDTVANKASPNGNALARTQTADIYTNVLGSVDDPMANGTVQNDMTGGSLPHENRMPYQAMNWCIATVGIFPSRN